jgi:hypothetical protein
VQIRNFGCFVAVFTFLVGSHLLAAPTTNPSTQPSVEGLIIEQRVTMKMGGHTMPPQTFMLKFKGKRMRLDVDKMVSTIILEDGTTVSLMHMNRLASTMSAGALKEGMERTASAPDNPQNAPKLTPTGEKQKIGDYDAEAYTFTQTMFGQAITTKMWIAPDYPDSERINAAQREFRKANAATNMTAGLMPGLGPDELPKGLVVRIESDTPNAGKMVLDTVSVQFAAVDDAEFEVPKDYQQSTMPMMPTGR